MNKQVAECINRLGDFCGKRDVKELTHECLRNSYGVEQADVMVLFGGSILCGGDVLAQAINDKIARNYIIVGGAGHTTETLRQTVHKEYPFILTSGQSEAEIFNQYLDAAYGLKADYLETKSTNCGNNITYLLDLLKEEGIKTKHIILCQDATMQYRMEAGLRKYVSDEWIIINYASYQARVKADREDLVYTSEIHGMWDMDRYVRLLMGEIPRLSDNAEGYGPRGKNFIAHVEIPGEVQAAFEQLKKLYGKEIREANPLYSSRLN